MSKFSAGSRCSENLPGYLRSTARANRRLVADVYPVYPYPLKPETQELEIQWVYMYYINISQRLRVGLELSN